MIAKRNLTVKHLRQMLEAIAENGPSIVNPSMTKFQARNVLLAGISKREEPDKMRDMAGSTIKRNILRECGQEFNV